MSKKITYWITGTRLPNFRAEGAAPAELVKWMLGFPKDVPPLAVVNSMFREGFRSCGFNGDTHWEPFELTAPEYEELVHALLAEPDGGYRMLDESPHSDSCA